MQADPYQTCNIAAEQPDVVAELDHLLLEWIWPYTMGPASVRDPFQEQLRAGIDPDLYCPRSVIEQRLIDLGATINWPICAAVVTDSHRHVPGKDTFLAR